jgi:hypothetical protein
MKTSEKKIIPLSKTKLSLMLIGSLIFVIGGFWLIIKRPIVAIPILGNPVSEIIIGIASIVFFGICAVFIAKKIFDNTAGLIIDDQGITDNSSGTSAGLILWENIQEIKKLTVFNQIFLMIIVKNPEDYINRQTGIIKRKAMELNYKQYGSPISISANGLQCNFNELYDDIQHKFIETKAFVNNTRN